MSAGARWAAGLDYAPDAIRSLFHPALLVFPVQRAGVLAGLSSPRWLTFLGCLPTIAFSTLAIVLVHRLARRMELEESTARAAAFLFAFAWMPLAYGSTSYPRPISGALLLAAFLLVWRPPSEEAAFASGVLAAAAATVRWSEGVYLVPLLCLVVRRTWPQRRPAALLIAGFAAGLVLFVGVFDALTWGQPFASLRAFVDFQRAARIADPRWFFYASLLGQWAGPVLLLLCAFAIRDARARAPLFVAASAVVLLSFSALKGIRYVLTTVPFLAIAAAIGWERLRRRAGWRRALAFVCLAAAMPLAVERALHLLGRKSQSAIEASRFLTGLRPRPHVVALEQEWAYGGRLYFGNGVEIRDILPARPLLADRVRASAEGADAVAVYLTDDSDPLEMALAGAGFRRCRTFRRGPSAAVVVYLRGEPACPEDLQNGQ